MSDPAAGILVRVVSMRLNPIDVHVGSQVRARREDVSMTVSDLAELLKVTTSELLDYEAGRRRISAVMLFHLSGFLAVSVARFFENMPEDVEPPKRARLGRNPRTGEPVRVKRR